VASSTTTEFLVRRRTSFFSIVPLLLLLPAEPQPPMFWSGVVLAVLGQAIRIWAAGTIHKSREVTTGGPYAYVRHPLYCGTFFITIAYGLMSGLWWSLALLLPLYFLLHAAAIASEERTLCEMFGDGYREYARRVGRFLPLPRRKRGDETPLPRRGAFSWQQVTFNHEHVTVLFTLTITLLFAARMVW
jgi:isoprenylcysteine carboxyl methyltransferase (ICMT) family protein YpbQ